MRDGFSLVYSFRNRKDILIASLLAANQTCPTNVDFYLVDADSTDATITALRNTANSLIGRRKVRICETSTRTTLPEAWNLGLMLTDTRYVIFSSSDVHFIRPGWFESIQNELQKGNEYVLLENHAVFGFDKKAIPRMGWFDETFVNGPHFDVDFMIRASEHGVRLSITPNRGYYSHADASGEETKGRLLQETHDRLPMHDFSNENTFFQKWSSSWPGWRPSIEQIRQGIKRDTSLPHPPTHISQVKRLRAETDCHPFYTKKMEA